MFVHLIAQTVSQHSHINIFYLIALHWAKSEKSQLMLYHGKMCAVSYIMCFTFH